MFAIEPSLQQGGCPAQHSTSMEAKPGFETLKKAMVCDVCREVYDEGRKTPLCLPCGHTFCRRCLFRRAASGQVACPSCSEKHSIRVESLTVNYSLLEITPLYTDLQYEECTTHRDALRYWCCTCGLALCILCLHSRHPQDHSVKLTQVFLQDEKLRLQEKLEKVAEIFEDQKTKLRDDFNNLDTCTKELFRKRASMQNIKQSLDDLFVKIKKAEDIASIQYLEKAVADFRPVAKTTLPCGEKATAGAMNDTGEDAGEQEGEETGEQEGEETCEQEEETTQAVMDFRDGQLHLLYPQMPSEVFLELSVGDRRLGCVYITLCNDMILAQHFLTFCMGMREHCLTRFKGYSKERNVINFRIHDYRQPGGEFRNYLLQERKYQIIDKEPEDENYIINTGDFDTIQFGICTKSYNGFSSVAFGMVVAGLEVAREAFLHDPVTAVTITDCGLVLPFPSLVPT